MDFYIFDLQFNFKGVIDVYESIPITRSYDKKTSFVVKLPPTDLNIELIKEDRLIVKQSDLQHAYIIETIEWEDGSEDVISATVFTLHHLLKRRIVLGQQSFTGSIGNVMTSFVNSNAITPVNQNRIIPDLIVSSDNASVGTITTEACSYLQLDEWLFEIANKHDITWDILFDYVNKKYIFKVWQGVNRSDSIIRVEQFRYVRDWTNGSTANTGNHWVEIQALDQNNVNVALNKQVSSNGIEDQGNPKIRVTDGSTITTSYTYMGSSGKTYVQVDLGALYDLKQINVWHYYSDARTYYETKTEVSHDGVNWFTVFDSAVSGTYVETSAGKTHIVPSYVDYQNTNDKVMFAKEFDNVIRQSYVVSNSQYKSVAIVAGEGEGTATKVVTVNDVAGFDRDEIFVEANDVDSSYLDENGVTVNLTTEQYNQLLIEKGNIALSENKRIETFDNDIDLNASFKFAIDYDLGDVISVKNTKMGIILHTRLVEYTETFSKSGRTVKVSFGSNIPTLLDKIKKMG